LNLYFGGKFQSILLAFKPYFVILYVKSYALVAASKICDEIAFFIFLYYDLYPDIIPVKLLLIYDIPSGKNTY